MIPRFDLIDLSTIDIILISDSLLMLALPYVTERSGFSGRVYATEPTIEFGRQAMQSLIQHSERSCSFNNADWKSPDVIAALGLQEADVSRWVQLFDKAEAQAAISKDIKITIAFAMHRGAYCDQML